MDDLKTLQAFREFLGAVARSKPASVGNGKEFAAFLKQVKPKIVGPIRAKWEALQPELAVLRPRLTDCNLLDRIVNYEDSYTESISWALSPATDPRTAELLQRGWLTSLGIDWRNATPVEPETQVGTEDGILDLLLCFETHPVVVEVKTQSDEHPAPSGKAQTEAYPVAARKKLHLSSQDPVAVVFLTPDGRKAENPDAICTSFARFALALAKALEQAELADDVRSALSMVITLFAKYSLPSIKDALSWQSDLTDDVLMLRIAEISSMTKLLLGET